MRKFFAAFLTALALSAAVGGALVLPAPAYAVDATDFTLTDLEGKQVKLSDYKDKVVLVSFWATWCGPCKAEMPHLQALYSELSDKGLVVLAVSSDDARTKALVSAHIKKNAFTFPVLLDPTGAVTATYNGTGTLPYSVLIGRNGEVKSTRSGYNPGDETALRDEVLKAL